MKLVLFDSDILAQRQPFVVASAQALDTVMQKRAQGYVSGHAVTNIFYILRRQIGNEAVRDLLARLLQQIQVASVTDEVIRQALQSSITAFEDAVTSMASVVAGLEIIAGRNTSDFTASSVRAMLSEEFLRIF